VINIDRPKKAGNGLSKKQFIAAVFSLACFALLALAACSWWPFLETLF